MKRQVMRVLTIKNKAEVAEIYISGEIIDDQDSAWLSFWTDGDTTGYEFPTKLRVQLDEVKDKPLEIHINSCGGSVFAGVAMANFIANHKAHTTTIIDGIAASIASVIFFSADECKMPSNAYIMVHRPFSRVEGNAEDLRKAAEILDTLQKGLETTYKRKAREDVMEDDIHAMMNAETWFTGDEAAKTFQIELIDAVKASNFAGMQEKLKALGAKKIPPALNFLSDKKPTAELQKRLELIEKLGVKG